MTDNKSQSGEQHETPPLEGRAQHIWCSVTISKKMEDVLIGYILNNIQSKENITEYVVYLSTTGGDPFAAVNLYNFIKSIPQKTTVYNMGTVASAGVPFFLGFQNRFGVPDCSFMVHMTTVQTSVFPNKVNVFDLEREVNSLTATDEKSQKIVLRETKSKAKSPLSAKAVKDAFLKSTTFHEAEALKAGFIEDVQSVQIPQAPDILYITDQALATLPG